MSQTVGRAIEVLRFIAEKPRTLTQIAVLLDVHKSTVSRLMHTLSAEGFARQDANGLYRLGFGFMALASTSVDDLEIRQVAHPHLQSVADQYGHTVHLAQLDNDGVRYIDKIEGRGTVAMGSRIGIEADLHTAGVAKAILAFADVAQRRRLERSITFTRYTETTIITPASLAKELEVTRARGWAEDDGEKEDYINCVALPIFDARGKVVASFSVTALRAIAPLASLRGFIPALQEVSANISTDLGWQS